jgi:hypothetical protein
MDFSITEIVIIAEIVIFEQAGWYAEERMIISDHYSAPNAIPNGILDVYRSRICEEAHNEDGCNGQGNSPICNLQRNFIFGVMGDIECGVMVPVVLGVGRLSPLRPERASDLFHFRYHVGGFSLRKITAAGILEDDRVDIALLLAET